MRPHRLAWSRTPPFHGENRGSNPLGDAKIFELLICSFFQGVIMFKQQIIGTVYLSIPVIFLYLFHPAFAGQLFCAFLIGLYPLYLNYVGVQNMSRSLLYAPTNQYLSSFNRLITECGLDPSAIVLRYAYSAQAIAMASGNVVIVDPVVWSGIDEDPNAQAVKHVYEQTIKPTLTEKMETRIGLFKEALTPGAQRFIFKHEVGHVVQKFSVKKLVVIFLIAFFGAYAGIASAMSIVDYNGYFAISLGLVVGCFFDYALLFFSNLVFKSREENNADLFAVKHSSKEDIQDAAQFFKKHQEIMDQYPEHFFFCSIPSLILSGHQNGHTRAIWLHKHANLK